MIDLIHNQGHATQNHRKIFYHSYQIGTKLKHQNPPSVHEDGEQLEHSFTVVETDKFKNILLFSAKGPQTLRLSDSTLWLYVLEKLLHMRAIRHVENDLKVLFIINKNNREQPVVYRLEINCGIFMNCSYMAQHD